MPVFYRGRHATITHRAIEIPCRERRAYALTTLSAVQAVRRGSGRVAARHRVLGLSALVTFVWGVPLAGQVSIVLAVVVGLALAGYAGACLRIRSGVSYQLLALCLLAGF